MLLIITHIKFPITKKQVVHLTVAFSRFVHRPLQSLLRMPMPCVILTGENSFTKFSEKQPITDQKAFHDLI